MESEIEVLALVWVTTTFVFTGSDRELSDFMRRVRFFLSNFNGKINTTQLSLNEAMSPEELFEYGKITKGRVKVSKTKQAEKVYKRVKFYKKFLSFLILLLTLLVLLNFSKVLYIYVPIYFLLLLILYVAVDFLSLFKLSEFDNK